MSPVSISELQVEVYALTSRSHSQKLQPGHPDPTEILGCGQKCHQSMKSNEEMASYSWLPANVVKVVFRSSLGYSMLTRTLSCSLYVNSPRTRARATRAHAAHGSKRAGCG